MKGLIFSVAWLFFLVISAGCKSVDRSQQSASVKGGGEALPPTCFLTQQLAGATTKLWICSAKHMSENFFRQGVYCRTRVHALRGTVIHCNNQIALTTNDIEMWNVKLN